MSFLRSGPFYKGLGLRKPVTSPGLHDFDNTGRGEAFFLEDVLGHKERQQRDICPDMARNNANSLRKRDGGFSQNTNQKKMSPTQDALQLFYRNTMKESFGTMLLFQT